MKMLIPSETYTVTELELRPQCHSSIASLGQTLTRKGAQGGQLCCNPKSSRTQHSQECQVHIRSKSGICGISKAGAVIIAVYIDILRFILKIKS